MRGPAGLSILALTSIIAVLFAVWIAVAWLVYANTMGPEFPASMRRRSMRAVLTTPEGWTLIVVGNLVGLGFAIVVLAISVVSFPMVVDKPRVGWDVAMRTSVRVARRSPMTVSRRGLIVVALLLLGAIPAFVGLAAVLPVARLRHLALSTPAPWFADQPLRAPAMTARASPACQASSVPRPSTISRARLTSDSASASSAAGRTAARPAHRPPPARRSLPEWRRRRCAG